MDREKQSRRGADRGVLKIINIFSALPDYPQKDVDLRHCMMLECSAERSQMDDTQYQRLKEKLRREYERKRAEHERKRADVEAALQKESSDLEADYRGKDKGLDDTWEMIQKDKPPEVLSIADMMRKVISGLEQPFQSWRVLERLKEDFPEASGTKMKTISGHLTRMRRRGELEILDRGSGTTPGQYQVKKLRITK